MPHKTPKHTKGMTCLHLCPWDVQGKSLSKKCNSKNDNSVSVVSATLMLAIFISSWCLDDIGMLLKLNY